MPCWDSQWKWPALSESGVCMCVWGMYAFMQVCVCLYEGVCVYAHIWRWMVTVRCSFNDSAGSASHSLCDKLCYWTLNSPIGWGWLLNGSNLYCHPSLGPQAYSKPFSLWSNSPALKEILFKNSVPVKTWFCDLTSEALWTSSSNKWPILHSDRQVGLCSINPLSLTVSLKKREVILGYTYRLPFQVQFGGNLSTAPWHLSYLPFSCSPLRFPWSAFTHSLRVDQVSKHTSSFVCDLTGFRSPW